MQVLQWLFKVGQDQKQAKDDQHSISGNRSNDKINASKVAKRSKDVVSHNKHKRVHRIAKKSQDTALDCLNFKYLALLLDKGHPRAYFSSTLNQKRLSSQTQGQQQHYILTMKMKKEDLVRGLGLDHMVVDSNAHVGNKVLPISDSKTSCLTSTSNANDQKDDKVKSQNNKAKTLSRMKELLRWAAAAKSEKAGKFGRRVLHFRNRSATLKSVAFDEQSNDSPKISFRWELESCSTICSAASAPPSLKYGNGPHIRKQGSWITTDDDFVVLEL